MGKDRATSTKEAHYVVVLALPGVVAFDLTIATHAFGHEGHGRYRLSLAGVQPDEVVTTTGFTISLDADLSAVAVADTVLVPGFARGRVPAPALDALSLAAARGARLASICTGAFALAQAGVLDGRRATTHWAHAEDLAREHPAVDVDPSVLYVDEGSVLTSAGVAAGIDLCLHMIATDHGEDAAIERARHMVAPLHRAGGQAQFIPARPDPTGRPASPSPHKAALAATATWAQDHLDQPLTIADLARRAMTSPRTFSRVFTRTMGCSPHAWLTAQRLRVACRLLERPDLSIEQIAHRCGLGSATNLRTHFRRAYATTPAAYRAAFTITTGPPDPARATR